MPYFSWKGVDIYGRLFRGRSFARSNQELDARLFARKIALMSAVERRPFFFFSHISRSLKTSFFYDLAQLLMAGVLLPDALTLVAEQQSSGAFQGVLHDVSRKVKEGLSIHDALRRQDFCFEPLIVEIVRVGHEASSLPLALQALADYLHEQEDFHRKLRAALMVPALTFLFFLGVLVFVLFGILPQFVGVFSSLGAEVPGATRSLLVFASWFSGVHIVFSFLVIVIIVFLVKSYRATPIGGFLCDQLMLKLPFFGEIIKKRASAHFLQALALLVEGGVPLVPAFMVAKGVVSNRVLSQELDLLVSDIAAGVSLGDALVMARVQMFDPAVLSLVVVGQESGKLGFFLSRAAKIMHTQAQRSIEFFARIVQPLLVIILGVLIALLILSVYMPLLTMADRV